MSALLEDARTPRAGEPGAGGFALSQQQQRLWRRGGHDGSVPPVRARIRIDGPLDQERLQRALTGLVARHEALRTGFTMLPGMVLPVQIIGSPESEWEAFSADLVALGPGLHALELRLSRLCADTASLGVLLRDLAALYEGKADALSEEPLQHADYAAWQREVLVADDGEGRRYWLAQVDGDAASLRLPLENDPVVPEQTLHPEVVVAELPSEMVASLARLAGARQASRESLLLAAWAILLRRHLGADRFGIGYLCDSRSAEIAFAIGPYARFLPLPLTLYSGETFADLAARLELVVSRHRSWQDLMPGEAVPVAEAGRGMLGFGSSTAPAPVRAGAPSLALEARHPPPEPCRLHLQVVLGEGAARAEIHYDPAKISAASASCMAEQLLAVLAHALAAPDTAWHRLSLLGPAERDWLCLHRGCTGPDPEATGLHELFERQAARDPAAPALRHAGREVTYGTLNRRIDALARRLRAHGLLNESRVVVLFRDPVLMVEAILAVLEVGGAYVPVDPAQPSERVAYILGDCAARLLVTEPGLASSMSGYECPVLLHDGRDEAPTAAATPPPTRVHPDQLAYLIYTSGSTGRPKGVAVTHGNALRSTLARESVYREPVTGFLLLSSFAFDSSVAGLFWTLSRGGCLCLPDEAELRDPGALAELVERFSLSHLLCLPSVWSVLLEQGGERLEPLRAAIVAGEACPGDLGARHAEVLPGTGLYNEYGPTEGTVWSSVEKVSREATALPVPIGRPVEGVRIHIFGEAGQELPRGVAGEIHIGGGGIARGYFRRPDLTAASFVPDPFGGAGERLYRTGDLGRWRLDGTVEFLGRADHQVKIRGYRVELGEIESRLRQLPEIRDCIVTLREDQPGDKRLCAYLVLRGADSRVERGGDPELLRTSLGAELPDYMIPSSWVVLDQLPRNANGKLDRARLPAPDRDGGRRAYVAPRSPVEAALAEIWQELLRARPIGIEDNFFELGGDSILSIQMVGRARQRGIVVTARQMIEHQTIARLAAVAQKMPSEELRAAPRGDGGGDIPLTPIQRWFFDLGYRNRERWTHGLLLTLRESLPEGALEVVLPALLRHHEALRARFHRDGLAWRQSILPEAEASAEGAVERIRLPCLPEAEHRAEIARRAGGFLAVEIGEGRMLRLVHFQGPGGEPGELLVVLHHLVADGLSWRILVEDLERACRQVRQGLPIALPPRSAAFEEWARFLASRATAPALAEEARWWRAQHERPVVALAPNRPEGGHRVVESALLTVTLGRDETEALLHRAAPAFRASVEDFLLTAVSLVLARRYGGRGEASVLIDLDRHGREAATLDLSRTIGWFTSVAPHVLTVDPQAPLVANLKKVKETIRQVPERGLGWGVLRYLAEDSIAAALREAPRAEIIFNYMGQLDPSFSADSLLGFADGEIRSGSDPEWERPYELAINADILDGQLRIGWDYGIERWQGATIESLASDHLELLRHLVAEGAADGAGGCTPSDFPHCGLSQDQLDELLGPASGIEDLYPLTPLQEGMLFHSLLEPGSGVYVEHLSAVLTGDFDLAAFTAAWPDALHTYDILRARFLWQGLEKPLQAVEAHVTLPIDVQDWRGLAVAEQEHRWAEYREADWRQGFDLSVAPLMRLALARRDDRSWYFLWSHHHILLDGWSGPLVLRHVFAVYDALMAGHTPRSRTRRPFRDYVALPKQQDGSAAERFFRRYLAGLEEATPLPLALPATSADPAQSQLVRVLNLDESETAALEAAARRHQVTLNTLVQAALAVVLGRCSGCRDVVLGISVSGRTTELAEIEEMVGLFINALPLRVWLPPEANIGAWLRELLATNAELRQYEATSLVDIQGWSAVPRSEPLFEILLAFENYPVDAALREQKGRLVATEVRFTEQTHYPLTVVAFPGASLAIQLSADPARLSEPALAQLMRYVRAVLHGLSAASDGRVADLQVIDIADRQQLVARWNRAEAVEPRAGCLGRLFEAVAEQTPHAIAVSGEGVSLTYGALNAEANRLAWHLRRLGIGPESKVGLCLDRSPAMIVAILAMVKAGGAYVPLDPANPTERLGWLITDAEVSVLLTEAAQLASLPDLSIGPAPRVFCLDRDSAALEAEPTENLPIAPDPDNLAYVIYTSGSTGQPKGVMVTHRNVLRLFGATVPGFGIGPADTWTLFHSCAFDFSVWEMWGALLHGGRVVVVPHWVSRSPEEFYDLLRRERVTVLSQTPSAFRQLLASDAFAKGERDLSLRLVIFGGEALEPRSLVPWFERYGDVYPRLVNMYGITETTVHVTSSDQNRARAEAKGSTIGRPIADLRALLLDADLQPVPPGIAGELFIGGAGLARGYLGRPGLTAERFIPDLFGPAGERLYRTGDLARLRPDGSLDYLGRIDRQVKLRGFRIELGEIESCLCSHPDVQHAVVLTRGGEDTIGAKADRALVAYVVPKPSSAISNSESETRDEAERLEQWQNVFDDTFRPAALAQDPRFNISGWNSSYTSRPIPAEEMREWVERTVERIRSLGPRRVLEIGCGTGLVLLRLASGCERYVGTDFSAAALHSLRGALEADPDLAGVETLCRRADDFAGLERGGFDTIVLNSVVQYFPDISYLTRVLESVAPLLSPGGRIFIGDVRAFGLLRAFSLAVELTRAPSSLPLKELERLLPLRLLQEEELAVDPAYFAVLCRHLPGGFRSRVLLKRARRANEMAQFRYDVILERDAPQSPEAQRAIVGWQTEVGDMASLRRILDCPNRKIARITEVPNRRIAGMVRAAELLEGNGTAATVEALRREAAATEAAAVDPEEVWALGEALGLDLDLAPSAAPSSACFDIVLDGSGSGAESWTEGPGLPDPPPRSLRGLASDPLRARRMRRLVPLLRDYLRDRLPDYMVPYQLVVLPALPLTLNGKIDRKALPEPELDGRSQEQASPETPAQETLVGIWSEVLGVSRIGIHDNFFELGGHSLLATQVMSRLRKVFGIEMPLRSLFEAPTPAALAERVEAALVDRIESLSEEEVARLLAQAGGAR